MPRRSTRADWRVSHEIHEARNDVTPPDRRRPNPTEPERDCE